MARKKDPPKPMFSLKHDFVASLDNLCNECIMMLQAVETVVRDDDKLVPGVRDILRERCKAFRAALSSDWK
jgi:hypothetical protein